MDQRLKERLIGAVVLVALAVWLIPWLLDGPEREPGSEQVALNLPAAEEAAPKKSVTIDLDESGRPAVPAENAAPATAESQPAVESRPPARAESESGPEGEAAAAGESAAAEAEQAERLAADARGEAGSPPVRAPEPEPAEASEPPETASESSATARTEEPDARTAAASAAGDWAVQLGSFGEVANAERLAERVKTFGYDPEVSTYRSGGRDLHRVRVGPQPSRARAEAVVSALSAHGFVAQVVTAD